MRWPFASAFSPSTCRTPRRLIREYLLHYGCAETLAALEAESGGAEEGEGAAGGRASRSRSASASAGPGSAATAAAQDTLALRGQLRSLLMQGRAQQAEQLLRGSYPGRASTALHLAPRAPFAIVPLPLPPPAACSSRRCRTPPLP